MPCQTALLWLHVSPPVPLTTAQLHPVRCGPHSAFLGFVTGSKPFFALDVLRGLLMQASSAALDERESRQKIERHPLQVSVWDSHNSLPQSEHCVLAVLEQGNPSSSAEFLTSTTSHRSGMGSILRFQFRTG